MAQFGPITFTGPIEIQAICQGQGGTTYSNTVIVDPACSLAVSLSANKSSAATGETVTWALTVVNNSAATVSGITVSDTLHVNYSPGGPYSLTPTQSVTLTGTSTTSTAGTVTNQAHAVSTGSTPLTGASGTVNVVINSTATCSITTQPSSVTGVAGTSIPTYFGGVASGPVKWQTGTSSSGPWTDVLGPPTTIPNSNSGWWRMVCVDNNTVTSTPVTVTVTVTPPPAILTVILTPSSSTVVAGSVITWTASISNTGGTTAAGITISDTAGTTYTPAGPFTLAHGADQTVTSHQLTSTAGSIVNTFTATSPGPPTVSGHSSTQTVTVTTPVTTPEFVTSSGRIMNPDGTYFWGAGVNAAADITLDGGGPTAYVFDGRPQPDIWFPSAIPASPGGDASYNYPGWGVTGGAAYDYTGGGNTTIPDRGAALNGTVSSAAASAGISAPADHWHQKVVRMTAQCRGGNWQSPDPSPSVSIPKYVTKVQQLLDLGQIVIPENHSTTGLNPVLASTFIANPMIAVNQINLVSATLDTGNPSAPNATLAGATQSVRDLVQFNDAMVAAFKTTGSGGSTHTQKGYVWFDIANEPWNSARDSNYDDFIFTMVSRIRGQGAHNIILCPFPVYCQALGSAATGALDSLITRLENAGLAWNLAWSWHAYGADNSPGSNGGYVDSGGSMSSGSYARMEGHIQACQNGTPGGKRFPLVVGEYGRPVPIAWSNAGPGTWNVAAHTYLTATTYGQPLAEKYSVVPVSWHATGDSGVWRLYNMVWGPSPHDDTNTSGQGLPFWRVDGSDLTKLTPHGVGHWNVSHNIWAKTGAT